MVTPRLDAVGLVSADVQRPVTFYRTLAAQCETPADVDRLHAELSTLGTGAHLAPFDAFWGQRYATVLDPDGIRVDLYAPLATTG